MFKKYLYLLIFSLSCFPLMAMDIGNVRDTENNGTISLINSQSADMSDFLPLAPQNPQHQALFNVAYGYLDFCNESQERLQSLDGYEQHAAVCMKDNIESAKNLVVSIWKLDQGLTTLDQELQRCLWGRLQLLEKRAECFRNTQEYVNKFQMLPEKYYIPTSPKKVEILASGDHAEDLMLAKQAIDRYQFLNLVIYQLFKLVEDPTKLSSRTKEYLSCSRTLWPILLDETTELSYPDFATITLDNDPLEYQFHKDYNYFSSNFEFQYYQVTPMTLGRNKHDKMTLKLSRVEIDVMEDRKSKDVLPLPMPTWLYRIHKVTSELNDGVEQKENMAGEILNLKKSKGTQNNKKETLTRKKTKKEKNKINRDVLIDIQNAGTNPGNTEEKSEKREPSSQIIDDRQDDLSKGKRKIEFQEKSFLLDEPKKAENIIPDAFPGQKKGENSISEAVIEPKKVENKIPDVPSQKYAYLPPKGTKNRSQESPQAPRNSQVDYESIKPYEKLIGTIFDYHKHGQGFNFGDFKSMWEHINGKGSVRSSKSGSSHRALLDKNGNVVTGTFAHGDSQTYTRTTVKYLRAALRAIGIEG